MPVATKMMVKNLFRCLLVLFLMGCSSAYKMTDSSNFRDRTQDVTLKALTFFNAKLLKSKPKVYGSISIDPMSGCFPSSDKPICKDALYTPTRKLNIEKISFKIEDRSSGISQEVEEFGHLIASELALQRGFDKMLIETMAIVSACSDDYSAQTYGSYSGSTYSGTTTIDKSTHCASSITFGALLFNDYEDIKKGIFFQLPNQSEIYPLEGLYYKARDILEMNSFQQKAYLSTPRESWKKYFYAKETSVALRKKYNVKQIDYQINIEANSEKTKSILEKLKVNQ